MLSFSFRERQTKHFCRSVVVFGIAPLRQPTKELARQVAGAAAAIELVRLALRACKCGFYERLLRVDSCPSKASARICGSLVDGCRAPRAHLIAQLPELLS